MLNFQDSNLIILFHVDKMPMESQWQVSCHRRTQTVVSFCLNFAYQQGKDGNDSEEDEDDQEDDDDDDEGGEEDGK